MKRHFCAFLMFMVIIATSIANMAQRPQSALAQDKPTPTYKYCHICDQMVAQAVVRVILFWMDGCPHCHEVIDNVLPPLRQQYGRQLEIWMIEVSTMEDINRLYEIGENYGLKPEQIGVPFMIIGDQVLIGSRQIPNELPGIIERYLKLGGVDYPQIPQLAGFLPETAPTAAQQPSPQATSQPSMALPTTAAGVQPQSVEPSQPIPAKPRSSGFTLAILILIGMIAVLLYGVGALALNKAIFIPDSLTRYAFPILSLIGLGVALYLAYVETQEVAAVCGPIGDCNAVQQSPYAKLFGVLPVGVLGAVGYVAILFVWFWGRLRKDWLAQKANLAVFVMTLFGLIFSIYLTYLEPFVIKAVCAWCLTSAVIMALLYFLSIHPLVQQWQSELDAQGLELETEGG
ncbi:MAG: vitamin K epoxide reductase family protein [Anaerolineales bacterium]